MSGEQPVEKKDEAKPVEQVLATRAPAAEEAKPAEQLVVDLEEEEHEEDERIALDRLHVQPGFFLAAVNRRQRFRARTISSPARGKPSLADGECLLAHPHGTRVELLKEDRKKLGLDDEIIVIFPISAMAGTISPEPAKK